MGALRKRGGVAEKHQIHPMTLYRWKRALQRGAETFLSGKRPKIDPQLRRLQLENQQLKEVLAIQTQELMLLKKIGTHGDHRV